MKELTPQEPEPGLSLNDLLFILFRHKRKIIFCTLAGILAAAFFYIQFPIYQSKAKLIVRYILDRSPVDKVESGAGAGSITSAVGELIINGEIEILNSADIAARTAESVGPAFLLPKTAAPSPEAAAGAVAGGLLVTHQIGSNVITVAYKNRNPEIPKRVLENVVSQYFDKHLQVHRSLGTFDFVMQQTEKARSQLHETEEQLKALKAKAGIISLAETNANLSTSLIKNQEEFNSAEVERAQQAARVKEIERWITGVNGAQSLNADQQAKNREGLRDYQSLGLRLDDLRRRERDLLARYTEENIQIKNIRAQIGEVERSRRQIERDYPGIIRTSAMTTGTGPRFDLVGEKTQLAAIDAKTATLSEQLHQITEKAARIAAIGTDVAQLERKRELEESNYRYFEASLEKARIDETLDPSRIPNISIVESPTEAQRDYEGMAKVMLGLVGGGVGTGLALAFLIELLFDRTIKRPLEIESRLRLPLLVSIPYLPPSRHLRLPETAEAGGETGEEMPGSIEEVHKWEVGHQLQAYFEAIRDRLILYFELHRMMRKPKMIAVTGVSRSAGISTVAGGLAASLSETGEGKVLLVNMNTAQAEVHPFFHGKPAKSLFEVLEENSQESISDSGLYLATAGVSAAGAAQFIPKKFYDLIPNLKASDFDYIIFDMPPLNQTSTTVAFAGFMDKVLMVVESGASHPETVKRAYRELTANKADVACVFNKARSWAPKSIEGEVI